jgi:hypothetical protein
MISHIRDSVCQSALNGQPLGNVFIVSEDKPVGFATVTPASGDIVWGNAIPVMWESTDTIIRSLFGYVPVTTAPAPAPRTTTASPAATSAAPNPAQTSSTKGPQDSGPQGPQNPASTSNGNSLSRGVPGNTQSSAQLSDVSSGATAATTASAKWNGSGPILTGPCGSPSWTAVDLSTADSFIALVGCGYDRTACCPFSVPPRTASLAGAAAPFPTQQDGVAHLSKCPDDYQTISDGCCPS